MITISVKLKDDNYMPKVDTAFVELAGMEKIKDGEYSSNKDVMRDCYCAAKALMKREWFRNIVISMVWKVGKEPEDDLVPFFNERLKKYGCLH